MNGDPEGAGVERLVERVQAGMDVQPIVERLKRRLDVAFEDRRLTPGSRLIEQRHRMDQRLDQLVRRADGADSEAIAEAQEVAAAYRRLVAEVERLPSETATVGAWGDMRLEARSVLAVARKEVVVILQGVQGLVLLGLFLLTFGIGLEAALGESAVAGVEASVQLVWVYAHSLDFLSAPLAGILIGHSLLNEERVRGTIHFLGSKPISRTGIAIGKWVGMAGSLGVVVAISALLVGGTAYAFTRTVGDPTAVVGFVAATFLVTLVFGTIALMVSGLVDRAVTSLLAAFGTYILLGPVWQNVFLLQSLRDLGAQPPAGSVLLYLASPFTAWWNLTSELLGPRSQVLGLPMGEPWHAALVEQVERGTLEALPFYATQPFYVLVILFWVAAGILGTVATLRGRDLA